jgi:uncharacterized peroxidase-related enzyme
MSRLQSVSVEEANGKTAELYSAIKSSIGGVPNIYQSLGNSPRALEIFLGIGGGLKGGLLSAQEQEAIALAVGQHNNCDYCLAAHTAIGGILKIPSEELVANRKGSSTDKKKEALLTLTKEIIDEKGYVSDTTLNNFRKAGYTDSHIPEVLLSIIQNTFTNYFNHINKTEVDFPAAPKL